LPGIERDPVVGARVLDVEGVDGVELEVGMTIAAPFARYIFACCA